MVVFRRSSAVIANGVGVEGGVFQPMSRGRYRQSAVMLIAVGAMVLGLYSLVALVTFSNSDRETSISSKQATGLFTQRWWEAQTENALRRRALVDLVVSDPKAESFEPFKTATGVNVWDLFVPTVTCPDLERIGPVGDGGKWVCGLEYLSTQRSCLMYSFGISNDISFEIEILLRTSCHIHAFDPTIGFLPFDNYNASLDAAIRERITFHKIALGGHSGASVEHMMHEALLDTMGRLGHDYVDIMKVDVEGAEWKAFTGSPYLPIGQLLIELHYQGLPPLRDFFAFSMRENHLHPFSREINLQPAIAGGMPVATEYSFINPKRFYSGLLLAPRRSSQKAQRLAPLQRPIKAVIYFLAQRKRTSLLKNALSLLYKHSWIDFPYPVVVFHDDLENEDKLLLQASVPAMPLKFAVIMFDIPKVTSVHYIPERTACAPETSTLGYRHMCRFHAHDVHRHLDAIGHQDREFTWRLDDDSSITHPIGYDVFRFMWTNKRKYGFVNSVLDDPTCVEGLWATARKFAAQRSEMLHNDSFIENWPDPLVFYNNFEISHVSIWRSPLWLQFMSFVDTHGGIYTLRWGDAPLHTIGVSMLLSKHDVHSFSDIGYVHNPFVDQKPRGLPKPNSDPFQPENCVFYGEWRCNQSNIGTINNATNHSTSRGVLFTFSKEGRETMVQKSIESFYLYYAKQHPTPFVVFYNRDSGFNAGIVQKGLSSNITTCTTVPVEFSNSIDEEARGAEYFLRFKAPAMLAARGFDWIWRFFDDSVLLRPVEFNVFARMAQEKKRYAYAEIVNAQPGSRFDFLWDLADKVCLVRGCSPAYWSWNRLAVIVSSFSISHSTVFSRSAACGALFEAVASNWTFSDSELHTVCVMMSLTFEDQWRVDDILYNSRWWQKGDTDKHFQATTRADLDFVFSPKRFGWQGGDVATSIPLPSNISDLRAPPTKLVWVFGDSIIGFSNKLQRIHAHHSIIANSVATATLAADVKCPAGVKYVSKVRYYWKLSPDGLPNAIFETSDSSNEICSHGMPSRMWPISGLAVIENAQSVKLVLLCVIACPNDAGRAAKYANPLAFDVAHSAVIVVHNPYDSPDDWVFDYSAMPDSLNGKVAL
jgi:hypothetical protein